MKLLMILALSFWGAVAASCAGEPDPRPMAEDPVCLVNRDLGCLRVRVDEDTPRATYKGKTYYFCTRMCKAEFERDPEKYVGHETGK